jgi:hypothetical protein
MTTLARIEAELEAMELHPGEQSATTLLALGEQVLERWLEAHDKIPTADKREDFRLIALHRQGAQGDPSFNACRETCREIAYRYNLARPADELEAERAANLVTMRRLVQHLALFVSGKLESAKLGEFCCSSRALRGADA